jgi:hypothetical protein
MPLRGFRGLFLPIPNGSAAPAPFTAARYVGGYAVGA